MSQLVGEEPPDNAYTNEGANLELLLGRVYTTDCIDDSSTVEHEDYDGYLRVAVTGGGDGGGEVAVEIVASDNPAGDYEVRRCWHRNRNVCEPTPRGRRCGISQSPIHLYAD